MEFFFIFAIMAMMNKIIKLIVASLMLADVLIKVAQANIALVDFENFQNINDKASSSKNQSWFGLSGIYQDDEDKLSGLIDADVRYYLNGETRYSLSESYVTYQSQSKNEYTLGRKKLDWNKDEAFWQLGQINGLRNFRLFDDKEEGLLGFFYKTKKDNIETQIFVSYFFIPTLNPGMKVEDGKVTSTMNWVKLPPSKTIIYGKETPIYYNIEKPRTRDIILKKSLGMQVKYDWNSGSVSAFSLYKPENNLRINAEAPFDPFLKRVSVTAKPVVNHHIIYGTQVEQKINHWDMLAGFISIDPNARLGNDFDSISGNLNEERKTFQSDFFKIDPKYDKERYLHMSASYQDHFRALSFNFINYLTNHEKGSDNFYSETTKFSQAIGTSGSYLFDDKMAVSLSWKYDLKRKDNLLSSEFIYRPTHHLRMAFGLELVKSPQISSYWSAYRANDTIYSSLGYFF